MRLVCHDRTCHDHPAKTRRRGRSLAEQSPDGFCQDHHASTGCGKPGSRLVTSGPPGHGGPSYDRLCSDRPRLTTEPRPRVSCSVRPWPDCACLDKTIETRSVPMGSDGASYGLTIMPCQVEPWCERRDPFTDEPSPTRPDKPGQARVRYVAIGLDPIGQARTRPDQRVGAGHDWPREAKLRPTRLVPSRRDQPGHDMTSRDQHDMTSRVQTGGRVWKGSATT